MTARQAVLDRWLERIEARDLWTAKVKDVGTVTAYRANGRVFLVQHFAKHGGWEIFVPSTDQNSTAMALDGAAVTLGVQGCRGLLD